MRSSPLTMLLVFAVTLFLSALLLFLVQPMVGKMILPMLGGSPAVWNTCMVFFQAMLLAGYAYAHATTTWLGPRRQAGLHLVVLALPFLVLPIVRVLPIVVDKNLAPKGEENPVIGVLILLTVAVGLPFFVVSASAPLLQKWFASTDHPAAKDPYFLYGASNLGSMLALVFYPWMIEPSLALQQQSWTWLAGFSMLLVFTVFCAILMWRAAPAPLAAAPMRGSTAIAAKPLKKQRKDEADPEPLKTAQRPVNVWRRLRWILLAAVPSSLMLGVTTYITTDIAAIPLLWVLPLGLYLLSFILVFSRLPAWLHKVMILLMPLMVLLLAFLLLSHMTTFFKQWQYILFHPAVLFIVAMVCHGELARDRPAPAHLTEFFMWMSVGGVLGGMFNALLAPVIFNGIVEYQLALVLACLVMPQLGPQPGEGFGFKFDLAIAASLAVLAFAAFYIGMHHVTDQLQEHDGWIAQIQKDGYDVPARAWEKSARLEGDVRTLLLGQAMVVGFVLLAPLGWFLSRDVRYRAWWFDAILPVGLCLLAMALLLAFHFRGWQFERIRDTVRDWSGGRLRFDEEHIANFLVFGLPALLCYIFVERPLRFGLAFGAFLLAYAMYASRPGSLIHQERSYFGVLKIDEFQHSNDLIYHRLLHGTTTHGLQCMDEAYRTEPLTYYHRNGPVGQLFNTYPELTHNFAVIGLGTGSMAAYGDKDHKVTYYEIDRHVREIAKNPKYFTYLTDYEKRRGGEEAAIVMGDARLQLEKANPPEKYGMILVDAFSSDAIPVHLITLEAVKSIFDKTAENGIVAYHISNRWLDLAPVLYYIARKLDLAALIKHDSGDDLGGESEWYASTWVALARKPEYLKRLQRTEWLTGPAREMCLALSACPSPSVAMLATAIGGAGERPVWVPLEPPLEPEEKAKWDKVGIWTDDFSNILSVFDWKR